MRISDVFAMGGGYGDDDVYYNDYEGHSDNPCYSGEYCKRPYGPFYYGPRGDRKGLAHILGSSTEGGGILGIFRGAGGR